LPQRDLIESHLGIKKNERLELNKKAEEQNILILNKNNIYKINKNIDLEEMIDKFKIEN
jgi:hypothetical protein